METRDPGDPERTPGTPQSEAGREYGYFIPEVSEYRRDISLVDAVAVIWRGKWLIALIVGLFIAVALAYALTAENWYRSTVLLAPADNEAEQSLLSGRLGGLGGLVGLGGLSGNGTDTSEAIAVLTSRDFIRRFIEENGLLPVLYPEDWDSENERWNIGEGEDPPDVREATRYFRERIQAVSQDFDTGLVTLTIEWTDPEQASAWAKSLIDRANEDLRARAMSESDSNIQYLRSQLETTTLEPMRDSIVGLLESEMQKYMLARGNDEYAFRIIDSPEVPFEKSRPRRALILVAATFLGFIVAVLIVLLKDGFSTAKRRAEQYE